MPGYPWKASDDAFLRKHFGKLTAAEISKAINRSVSSIYQHAAALGLIQKRDPVEQKRRRELVAKHTKQGLSDSEVAAIVGIERRTVGDIRTKLGIPANGRSERYRKRVAENTRIQCQKAGVNSLAEIKSQRVAGLARKYGWPEHLSLRSIQIAEVLYRRGPMTRKQIAEAVGLPWKGRGTFKNRHVPRHSYMSELMLCGIVVKLDRAIKGKGKGKSHGLYMIALGVDPCPKSES